ncbi:MAG: 16S rRNA (cytosine(1402)-N(4))-methyltransferase RsmH [Gammaproteobacteria bacterium]|nr:16S rRNA (cytosine(1402)-N(4))-methyltransferase RsmH [Gammaproteobacteria bacterium]
MTETFIHHPVLLKEAVEALSIKENGIYIDGTFGRGGHAAEILKRLGLTGRLLAIDKDEEAVAQARRRFEHDKRFFIERGTFALLNQITKHHGCLGKVDGVLLDLGVSSPQIDDSERGFSFKQDGPLDMRMDRSIEMTAAQWLAKASENEIASVLKEYGEEKFSRRIARAIVTERETGVIETTRQLAKIISDASPFLEKNKDPATRSFQGIRIFINNELDDLKTCLSQVVEVLANGGRLAVISFHSLEDRIVKRFIREQCRGDAYPLNLPVTHSQLKPNLRAIGKVIRATDKELSANPRARSAVLRVAEKI